MSLLEELKLKREEKKKTGIVIIPNSCMFFILYKIVFNTYIHNT